MYNSVCDHVERNIKGPYFTNVQYYNYVNELQKYRRVEKLITRPLDKCKGGCCANDVNSKTGMFHA